MRFCVISSYLRRILTIYKRFPIFIPGGEVREYELLYQRCLHVIVAGTGYFFFSHCALRSTIFPSSSRVWQSVLIPGEFFPVERSIFFFPKSFRYRVVIGKPCSFSGGLFLFPARCRGILDGPYSYLRAPYESRVTIY